MPPGPEGSMKRPLTPREAQLWRYVAEGKTDKVIAHDMGKTPDGLKHSLHLLRIKLGMTYSSRVELALAWLKQVKNVHDGN